MITEYKNLCLICGKQASEMHHLIFGYGKRALSDEDGLIVPLCGECHKAIHLSGAAGALSKIVGQLQWESERGGVENTREEFRKRYGISYL